MQDPFYVVKEEVQQSVNVVTALRKRWQELVDKKQFSSDEFDWLTNELNTSLRGVEWDLQDLDETIAIVERDRAKFKLDDGEIQSRKRFVAATKQSVKEIRDALNDPMIKGKMHASSRETLYKRQAAADDRYQKMDDEAHSDNTRLLENEQQKQAMIMRKQDQDLDLLSGSVSRLGEMGKAIHVELDEQNRMIADVEKGVEDTGSRMHQIQKRLDHLLNNSEKGKMCTIVVLLIVLIVLVVLVVN